MSSEEPDRRVMMFRKGERKIFRSPEDVPAGEGWVDSPAKASGSPEPKSRGRHKRKTHEAPDGSAN